MYSSQVLGAFVVAVVLLVAAVAVLRASRSAKKRDRELADRMRALTSAQSSLVADFDAATAEVEGRLIGLEREFGIVHDREDDYVVDSTFLRSVAVDRLHRAQASRSAYGVSEEEWFSQVVIARWVNEIEHDRDHATVEIHAYLHATRPHWAGAPSPIIVHSPAVPAMRGESSPVRNWLSAAIATPEPYVSRTERSNGLLPA